MKIRTVKSILAGLCAAALLVGCGSGYANSSTSNQMYEGAAADYEAKEEAYATADTYDTDEPVGAVNRSVLPLAARPTTSLRRMRKPAPMRAEALRSRSSSTQPISRYRHRHSRIHSAP